MDSSLPEQEPAEYSGSTWRGILLMLLCTFFVAAGQIFYKLASTQANAGNILSYLNWPLITGLVLYGIGSVLLLSALKYGQLSVVYPFLAVSYIWVGIGAPLVFRDEVMALHQWIGVGSVVLGVALVGLGGGRG